MPKFELTDKACKQKPIPGQQLDLIDTLTKGLVLRISPGRDVRAWRFHYRWQGERKMLPLGWFPETSLSKARELAKAHRITLADGIDPGAAPVVEQRATVAQVIEEFLTEAATTKRSHKEMARRLRKNITPHIGNIVLSELRRGHIVKTLKIIRDRGAKIERNRVHEDLSSCLYWAVNEGYIELNPMAKLKKEATNERERNLSADEIRLMWERLPSAPMTEDSRNALRLALACGQRIGEVTGMVRGELDLDNAIWHLPEERVKNGRAHSVPLNAIALGIIRAQLREGCEHVFRNKQGEQLRAAGVPHALARGPAGEKTKSTLGMKHFTPHDLRRTFGSHLAGLGVTPAIIERLINHVSGKRQSTFEKHYNKHKYEAEKREAMELWGERLAAIISGGASVVVPLKSA